MIGISPKLPLSYMAQDGPYAMNRTYEEAIKQNFKNLMLTSPGERIMDPNFGVGLRRFLFEPSTNIKEAIITAIKHQSKIYMPYISINRIQFSGDEDSEIINHFLKIKINFSIIDLNLDSFVEITVE